MNKSLFHLGLESQHTVRSILQGSQRAEIDENQRKLKKIDLGYFTMLTTNSSDSGTMALVRG